MTPCCTFCSAPAAALLDMPQGCLCSDRQYQYRCVQHMMRASDTSEQYSIVTTFPDYNLLMRIGAGR
jgi:hypothetical protein